MRILAIIGFAILFLIVRIIYELKKNVTFPLSFLLAILSLAELIIGAVFVNYLLEPYRGDPPITPTPTVTISPTASPTPSITVAPTVRNTPTPTTPKPTPKSTPTPTPINSTTISDIDFPQMLDIEDIQVIPILCPALDKGGVNTIPFVAGVGGTYRIDMSEILENSGFRVSLYNDTGGKVNGTSYVSNNEGMTFENLSAGKGYNLTIENSGGYSTYQYIFWAPKIERDITDVRIVRDSIQYMDQRNKYTFYANRDGYYRFDFSEMRAKCGVRVCVKNKLGENISGTSYCENEGGVTVELSVNESPYTVYVEQTNGYTEYYMQIGIQKEMVPIVDNEMIIDSTQFMDQQNIYKYIPTTAGEKTIAIGGIQNDVALYLAMYDHLGYLVTDGRNYISGNQETVQTKKLNIGEEYLIKIEQETGFSKYSIKIGN